MLCYRDRTYCETPMCGNPECSRIVTAEVKAAAEQAGLPIAYAIPCLAPVSAQSKEDLQ